MDNTLLDLHSSSHPTQPHSIIANYTTGCNPATNQPRCWGGVLFKLRHFLLADVKRGWTLALILVPGFCPIIRENRLLNDCWRYESGGVKVY